MTDTPAVVVTRPAGSADSVAARLTAMGFTPLFAPMLRIVPRTGLISVPAGIGAVAVTSANALPALPPALRGTRLFAVGDATAAAARDAGCTDVVSADGNAEVLGRMMAGLPGRVLVLAGAGQGFALAAALRSSGCRVTRRVAYAARPAGPVPAPVLAALRNRAVHGVLFLSGATAERFASVLPAAYAPFLADVVAACIGATAADAVRHLPWRHLRVSCRPNLRDTLAQL